MSYIQRYRSRLLSLPKPIYWLAAGAFASSIGRMGMIYLVLYLTGPLAMPLDHAAGLMAIYGASSFAGSYCTGLVLDRIGMRTGLRLSTLGSAIAFTCIAMVQGWWLLVG